MSTRAARRRKTEYARAAQVDHDHDVLREVPHRRRTHLARRRLWFEFRRNLLTQGLFIIAQASITFFVILVIWCSWAYLFQMSPTFPDPIDTNKWTEAQVTQSLAAYSELASTIASTLLFYADDNVIAEGFNNLMTEIGDDVPVPGLESLVLPKFYNLKLKPASITQEQVQGLSPVVLDLKRHNADRRTFTFQAELNVTFATVDLKVLRQTYHVDGLYGKVHITLAFPSPDEDFFDFYLLLDSLDLFVTKGRDFFFIRQSVNLVLATIRPKIWPILYPSGVEWNLRVVEQYIRAKWIMKRDQFGYIAQTMGDGRTSDEIYSDERRLLKTERRNSLTNTPPKYQRTLSGTSGRLAVPGMIQGMRVDYKKESLGRWVAMVRHAAFTFAQVQRIRWRQRRSRAHTVLHRGLPGIRCKFQQFTLGLDSADDLPDVVMMADQHPAPYTYLTASDLHLRKFHIKFSVKGLWGLYKLGISIRNVRMHSEITIHALHPLLVHKSYLTFFFTRDPIIDIDCDLVPGQTHFLGISLPNSIEKPIFRFLSDYTLKSLLLNWIQNLLRNVRAPRKVHIPWVDDPTEFVFSSSTAQNVFNGFKYLFKLSLGQR